MSEQAILSLGSIGSLGGYLLIPESIDCMHLGSSLEYFGLCGCSRVQPSIFTTDQPFHSEKHSGDTYLPNVGSYLL